MDYRQKTHKQTIDDSTAKENIHGSQTRYKGETVSIQLTDQSLLKNKILLVK